MWGVYRKIDMVITAANSVTPVGYNAEMTAASVRAGISRLVESEDYYDIEGNPITAAYIEGINSEEGEVQRMEDISRFALEGLLKKYFKDEVHREGQIHLLLGVAPPSRPGPRYEGEQQEVANHLVEVVQKWTNKVTLQVITSGNPSAIECMNLAHQILEANPQSLCIIGGVDSLMALKTLDWFEEKERLISDTFGRNQAFAPGEAVGFMIMETKEGAMARKKDVLAELAGVGLAKDPSPFLSEEPSKGEGLSKACRAALSEGIDNLADIDIVLGDLNGEYFRAKEWGYTELRCFGNCNENRRLLEPASCMGAVGAASGAVLINIAAVGLSRGWFGKLAMVFCSDDEGDCGAVVLRGSIVKGET